jgi:Fe-S cluster biogenesis protein NfuA
MSQAFVSEIERICAEVLAPLVEGDGGELWIVAISTSGVHLHLSGSCSGCPGTAITHEHFLAPAIRVAAPTTPLRTTNGFAPPSGARRVRPRGATG